MAEPQPISHSLSQWIQLNWLKPRKGTKNTKEQPSSLDTGLVTLYKYIHTPESSWNYDKIG